jgi:hypothetical protein
MTRFTRTDASSPALFPAGCWRPAAVRLLPAIQAAPAARPVPTRPCQGTAMVTAQDGGRRRSADQMAALQDRLYRIAASAADQQRGTVQGPGAQPARLHRQEPLLVHRANTTKPRKCLRHGRAAAGDQRAGRQRRRARRPARATAWSRRRQGLPTGPTPSGRRRRVRPAGRLVGHAADGRSQRRQPPADHSGHARLRLRHRAGQRGQRQFLRRRQRA